MQDTNGELNKSLQKLTPQNTGRKSSECGERKNETTGETAGRGIKKYKVKKTMVKEEFTKEMYDKSIEVALKLTKVLMEEENTRREIEKLLALRGGQRTPERMKGQRCQSS